MSGTGFMKCMPATRSGRPVSAPKRVTEMLDVFVRRSASEPSAGVELPEERSLERKGLARGLDREVDAGEVPERPDGPQPPERGLSVEGAQLPLLYLSSEPLGDALARPLGSLERDVGEQHGEPFLAEHLGDAGAHLAGADHAGARKLLRHHGKAVPRLRRNWQASTRTRSAEAHLVRFPNALGRALHSLALFLALACSANQPM